jgi:mannose-6-phosphate isomerase-like protein (cupin superfamily)
MNKWVGKGSYLTKLLGNEEQMSCKGIQIQIVKLRGKEKHYHKRKSEFFYFLKDGGIVTIGSKKQHIRKGLAVIIRPNTIHSFTIQRGYVEALMVKTNHKDTDTFYK